MKLHYRGLTYDYTPPVVEMGEEKVGGVYRGLEWRFRNLKKAPVMQTNLDLKYRGVAYHVGAEAEVSAPVVTAEMSVGDKARELMIARDRTIKNRQQSMLSRLSAEVGLVGNTAQYWSRIQGKIQPTFRATYDHHVGSFS